AATYYAVDNSSCSPSNIAACTIYGGAFTITSSASHTVYYFSKDNAGNFETRRSVLVNIDKTPPTITGAASPAANAAGWNNSDVTVSFTCADALSAVASCAGPTTLSSDGAAQSVTGTASDNAGNTASATVSGINIDKTPPVITATAKTADGASYTSGTWTNQ